MHSEKMIEFLNEEFLRRKAMRPNYSYRAFADYLQMDASTLIQILKGKRKLSFEKAGDILSTLDVPLDQKNSLLLSLADPSQYTKPKTPNRVLSSEELLRLKDWEGLASVDSLSILQLVKTAEGIAERIGAEPEKVRTILDYCSEIGLVRKVEDRYESLNLDISTAYGYDPSLIDYHHQWLNKSIEHLLVDRTDSDFSGSTVVGSKTKMEECRRRIRDFRRSLIAYLQDDVAEKDELFRINIQFFPVRENKKTDNEPSV